MNIGIDHGYYAIKTRHFSFPAGIAEYSHEPYTLQNTLEFGGKFYVCGTGRQPILRNKMENDNYYLLTLAAIAKEIKQRGGKTECSVRIAAGLPLAGFGREKKPFREYLLRSSQPVCFKFEGIAYKITIEDVKLFPQGYDAKEIHEAGRPRRCADVLLCGFSSEFSWKDWRWTYGYDRRALLPLYSQKRLKTIHQGQYGCF